MVMIVDASACSSWWGNGSSSAHPRGVDKQRYNQHPSGEPMNNLATTSASWWTEVPRSPRGLRRRPLPMRPLWERHIRRGI